jgi:hypothetical protein
LDLRISESEDLDSSLWDLTTSLMPTYLPTLRRSNKLKNYEKPGQKRKKIIYLCWYQIYSYNPTARYSEMLFLTVTLGIRQFRLAIANVGLSNRWTIGLSDYRHGIFIYKMDH